MTEQRTENAVSGNGVGDARPTVGFIGLGTMGSRMCANLLKDGFPLVVFDLAADSIARLTADGATAAASPADLAGKVDVLLLSLPNAPDVEAVAFGEDGIVTGAREGLVVVDHTTLAPAAAQGFAERIAGAGVSWLDAPVSGGPAGAAAGTLTIMIGGEEAALERFRPVLDCVGGQIEYMGASGLGATTKIVNQLACSIEMLAMFEAFTVGAAAGIPARKLWDVLHTSSSRCWIMEDVTPPVVLENEFDDARFALKLMHKDVKIALETAESLRVPAAGVALSESLYSIAEGRGWGDKDHMAVINLYGEAAGIDRW
jgi:3-hydroxyisobutyrate dehydrogenase